MPSTHSIHSHTHALAHSLARPLTDSHDSIHSLHTLSYSYACSLTSTVDRWLCMSGHTLHTLKIADHETITPSAPSASAPSRSPTHPHTPTTCSITRSTLAAQYMSQLINIHRHQTTFLFASTDIHICSTNYCQLAADAELDTTISPQTCRGRCTFAVLYPWGL
jgi:hypothetical protein